MAAGKLRKMTTGLIEGKTVWFQKEIQLSAKAKGCHLLDDEVLAKLPEIASLKVGTAHIFSMYLASNCVSRLSHAFDRCKIWFCNRGIRFIFFWLLLYNVMLLI